MNIDELQAGRELDALVAEMVMGWRKSSTPFVEIPMYRDALAVAVCCTDNEWWWISPDNKVCCPLDNHFPSVPRYSTNIKAAWQAVEKITQADAIDTFDLQWYHEDAQVNPKPGAWCAVFIPFDDSADWYVGDANTAPLAISRAALKAVMDED